MANLIGSAAIAAYKQATTWGTAVLLGDGDQVLYVSEDVTPDPVLTEDDQITGEALSGPSDVTQFNVTGGLNGMKCRYNGHERWMEHVFGVRATTGASGAFQHKFDWLVDNPGKFGTLAIEKVVTGPHEIDSFKPMGMEVAATPDDGFARLTITGIGRQLRTKDPDRTNDSSTTWTLPGLGAAPAPSTPMFVTFGHITVEIGAQDVTPVYTAYCVSGLALSFQRNSSPSPTTCDGIYSSEPVTDVNELTGTFDFPVYDDLNDPLVDARLSGQVMTGKITFDSTMDLGAGPDNYRWIWWLPAFQITGDGYPNVDGKGKIPLTVAFTCHNATIPVDTDATMPRLYIHSAVADSDDYGNS